MSAASNLPPPHHQHNSRRRGGADIYLLEAPPPDDDTGDEEQQQRPPHDLHAEQSVLGAMLLTKTAITDVTATLTGRDFYTPAHELIYDTITGLHSHGQPVDVITVTDALHKNGTLNRAGGQAYLHQLVSAVPTAANADYYARIVAGRATDRRLTEIGQRLQHLGHVGGEPADKIATAQQEIATLTAATADTPAGHDEAVYTAVADLEKSPGTPTPWASLTDAIAGWKPACLYLIGARPGIGKSVAGVTAAIDIARRGQTALIYSLEMSRTEIYHRMIASVGDINMTRIQHRNLTAGDWENVAVAAKHITDLPLHVDDRAALSLPQIRASITAAQKTSTVGAVIIDYLQLLTPPMAGAKDDRRVQVDSISRGLKAIAKDFNIPIIALTQLNRGLETRADKTPTLADLREAGGQEQDADVVLLMHRDITGQTNEPNVLKLVVAKNRHGPQSVLELAFRGEHSRIEEPTWTPHGRTFT